MVSGDPAFRHFFYFELFFLLLVVAICIYYFRYNKIEVNRTKYLVTDLIVLLIAAFVFNFIANLRAIIQSFKDTSGDFLKDRTHIEPSFISSILLNLLKRNLLFFGCILLAGFITYYASRDPSALMNIGYLYLFAISLLLTFGYYLTPNDVREVEEDSSVFLYKMSAVAGVSAVVAILFYACLLYLSTSSSDALNMFLIILIGFIVIVALAIIYYFFGDYLKRQTGVLGFIIQFIFYIPCLFSEFILFIKNQMKITPSVVYILFILEILLIIIYFYLPKMINSQINKHATSLLNAPLFLDSRTVISQSDIFLMKNKDVKNLKDMSDNTMSPYINSNYSFSFWVFINSTKTGINKLVSQEDSSNPNFAHEIEIFNYANGKPRITYVNDRKNDNYFNVYFTNSDTADKEDIKLKLTIPLQKWTYFVFNYLNNSADLFIDGNLEKTFQFDENNFPLNGRTTDTVSVGNDNGINGAICNVMFYDQPLTEKQIVTNYNMLVFSNPPVQE
jgi:hypothetical protein